MSRRLVVFKSVMRDSVWTSPCQFAHARWALFGNRAAGNSSSNRAHVHKSRLIFNEKFSLKRISSDSSEYFV